MLHRIALLLLILCLSTAAYARSGGSMGGGGFRSHSSGSSFGGGRSSSPSFGGGSGFGGGSSSGGWYGSRTYFVPVPIGGSRSGNFDSTWLWVLVLVAILIAFVYLASKRAQPRPGMPSHSRPSSTIWTARVQFGIQTQAWGLVDHLDDIARKAQTTDAQGLHALLTKSVGAIRPFVDNVEYTATELKKTKDPIEAEQQFGRWTGAARSSYNREVVRADRFGVQEEQREIATDGIHDEDGQLAVAEFFVLTIVIGLRELDVVHQFPKGQPTKILESLAQITTSELLALEIIWTPASKSDAMSRDDLETTFPDLVAL